MYVVRPSFFFISYFLFLSINQILYCIVLYRYQIYYIFDEHAPPFPLPMNINIPRPCLDWIGSSGVEFVQSTEFGVSIVLVWYRNRKEGSVWVRCGIPMHGRRMIRNFWDSILDGNSIHACIDTYTYSTYCRWHSPTHLFRISNFILIVNYSSGS